MSDLGADAARALELRLKSEHSTHEYMAWRGITWAEYGDEFWVEGMEWTEGKMTMEQRNADRKRTYNEMIQAFNNEVEVYSTWGVFP